jgi:hypothetical protein
MDTGGCLSLQIVFKRLSSRSRYGQPTVESALRLDIDAMMRWGGIRPGDHLRGEMTFNFYDDQINVKFESLITSTKPRAISPGLCAAAISQSRGRACCAQKRYPHSWKLGGRALSPFIAF